MFGQCGLFDFECTSSIPIRVIKYFLEILIVVIVTVATTILPLILFSIYFSMYNVKHSQVEFYLIRLNTYFIILTFFRIFII